MNLQMQFRQLEDDQRYKEANELYNRLEAEIGRLECAIRDTQAQDEDDFEAQVEARLKGVSLEVRPAKPPVNVETLRRELSIVREAYKIATEKRGRVIDTVKREIALELKAAYYEFIKAFAAEAIVYAGFVKDEDRLRNAILMEDSGLELKPMTVGMSLATFNPNNRDSWLHMFLRDVTGRGVMTRAEADQLLAKQGLTLGNWE